MASARHGLRPDRRPDQDSSTIPVSLPGTSRSSGLRAGGAASRHHKPSRKFGWRTVAALVVGLAVASLSVWAATAQAAGSSNVTVKVSTSADRSKAKDLADTKISKSVAIFTASSQDLTSVSFYLDDPTMRSKPSRIESYAPFDFAGTAGNGSAVLFNVSRLKLGKHEIDVKATRRGGSTQIGRAVFTVVDATPVATPPATSANVPTTQPAAPTTSPTTAPPTKTTTTSTTTVVAAPAPPPVAAPSSSAVGCLARPSGCGFPDVTNTGASGTLTKASGTVTLNTAGAVYENMDLAGCITVTAPNVTIRNVKVTCNAGTYSIDVFGAGSATISHATVSCGDRGNNVTGIGEHNLKVDHVNVSLCENGFDLDDHTTITDTYCHDLQGFDDDCIQGTMTNSTVIRHNTLITDSADNSAIEGDGAAGSTKSDWVVDNNLLAGGGYTLYCPGRSSATGVSVTNNRFGPFAFGPATACNKSGYAFTQNIMDATAATVAAQ